MHLKAYNQFLEYLKKEQKDQAVIYAMSLLEEKKLTIEELYQELLAPSLTTFECDVEDQEVCIWKEHFRTSIIRTILESCYLYIIKRVEDVKKTEKKIVVFTPSFEYHEIGAIMVSHFLLLEGFDASYIGANTPKDDILSAIKAYHPDFVAMSVTNPYNLVITKQINDEIKKQYPDVKIIIGGQAFVHQNALESIKYDYLLQTLDDIKNLRKEVQV
ncbi:MAG: cobalamin B12-binding domain-containing protein [Acholeplasmataceae bacterium]|nr:cobalamin B12-binding domain-containing protein [Acholeplasmataceae bacterium]